MPRTDLLRWTRSRAGRRLLASLRRSAGFALTAALGLAVAGAAALLAVRVPQWQAQIATIRDVKDRISLENEIVKNFIQLVGGALFLLGVYFTWRNFRLAQEGQITQRFNDAIEHLGSDKAEVRLGGIYALARIARDSPKDHIAVMQVFCSYVRETTKRAPAEPVTAEVQAILTMIATRTLEHETDEDALDLSESYLPGVNLRGAQLERLNLKGANLSRAMLDGARLRGAMLRRAVLEGADLRKADLRETDLMAADLRWAAMREALLDGADVFCAQMEGTRFLRTDLSGVKNAIRKQIAAAITDETTTPPVYQELAESDFTQE